MKESTERETTRKDDVPKNTNKKNGGLRGGKKWKCETTMDVTVVVVKFTSTTTVDVVVVKTQAPTTENT